MAERAAFDKDAFGQAFLKDLEKLVQSERITKDVLRGLSRTILEATHETGDIGFVNRLLAVLTPIHRKVAVVFFKHFTGFSYDDDTKLFTKKSKKRYDKAHADYVKLLADVNLNIWSWSERHIEIQQKPFKMERVSTFITTAIEKAKGQGLNEVDVLRHVLKGGITADHIISIMDELGYDVDQEESVK